MITREAVQREIAFKDVCIFYTERAMQDDRHDIFGNQLVRLKSARAELKALLDMLPELDKISESVKKIAKHVGGKRARKRKT